MRAGACKRASEVRPETDGQTIEYIVVISRPLPVGTAGAVAPVRAADALVDELGEAEIRTGLMRTIGS
jgi:hypothetical protein